MNNPDHISESFETIIWVKILKFFDAGPGSGMKKIRIRDGKNSDPGSGINIPDPQHCPLVEVTVNIKEETLKTFVSITSKNSASG